MAGNQHTLNTGEGWEFVDGELVPWEPVVGKRKYTIRSRLRCPLCNIIVSVSTAGPKNIAIHQEGSKCRLARKENEKERRKLESARVKAAKALARYHKSLRRAEEEEDDHSATPLSSQDASSMTDSKPPASPLFETEPTALDPLHVGLQATSTTAVVSQSVPESSTGEVKVEIKTESYSLAYPAILEYDDGMESFSELMDRASPPIYMRTGLLDDWSEVGS
ncbi:hypothetical protein BDV93DRAFT_543879 [Ceratobasidium sp. AG-I]|nr:hypothetical protein BDV93DRAFT_543879 [Ceratobasidium sp. AG-I]